MVVPPAPAPGPIPGADPTPPTHPTPPTDPAPAGGPGDGAASIAAVLLVGLWATALTWLAQAGGWVADQLFLVSGQALPGWVWPLVAMANAALVALPAAVLASTRRSAAMRTAGRAWLVGAAALGGLGVARAVPAPRHEAYLALLAGLAAAGGWLLRRAAGARPVRRSAVTGYGVAGGLFVLLPWAWVGALGGPAETLLAALAAAALGWLGGHLLDGRFWAGYAVAGAGAAPRGGRLVLLGGFVAGVTLLLLGAGAGAAGSHLAMLALLPALGFAAGALVRAQLRADAGAPPPAVAAAPVRAALGALVGAAALGPLAFADPEEVTLLLIGRDVPFWTLVATAASTVAGLLAAAAYGVAAARPTPARRGRRWHRRGALVAAAAVALAGGAVHLAGGQPGWHGDRLFVVLRAQPDLTGLPTGTGPHARAARLRAVYERLVAHAVASQAGLRRDLGRWGLAHRPYYLVNAVEVTGGPAVRAWLSRRADVDRVLASQRLRPLPAPPTAERGTADRPGGVPWNLSLIGADRVWAGFGVTGAGITVGSADSGVDGGHPALAASFRGGDDSWHDPWNGSRAPTDRNGHGTHTLATAVGERVGVAPGANWVGCVNLDRNLGNPASYLDCLQFLLAPFPFGGDPFRDGRPERAPHVLTNSWGCPPLEGCDLDVLRPAAAAFAAAGVFFVAAAGNTGPTCGSVADPPAAYADALTVGAVDRNRSVTDFSSRGPAPDGASKPDLLAPGAGVRSALPGGGYGEQDGTSMATPHVAGVVALMWSANPDLVGDVVGTRRLLAQTARPVPPPGTASCGTPANTTGAGLVDAHAAVQAARAAGAG